MMDPFGLLQVSKIESMGAGDGGWTNLETGLGFCVPPLPPRVPLFVSRPEVSINGIIPSETYQVRLV
jgi:hypothetical protein